MDFETSPWRVINANLALYRFQSKDRHYIFTNPPILMLHGPMTNHRTWDTLASYLWANGFEDVFAVDIDDIQFGNPLQKHHIAMLNRLVDWILAQYPPDTNLVMIGHSTGGVLARRFLFKSPFEDRISFLFTLASPHHRTHFTHAVYVPAEYDMQNTPPGIKVVKTAPVPQNTFTMNFFGNAVGPEFDGTVRGIYLPDAINMVLPLEHNAFKQHESVFSEMLACMRGERFRVQLYLESLHMVSAAPDGEIAPFFFEINGMRSPFDGIFQAEADHIYTFDENNTPLAALGYSDRQALVSLIFRLKDLSRAGSVKRRLFAKLLVTLGKDVTAVHEMQDNQGSTITIRVHTQRMPAIIGR